MNDKEIFSHVRGGKPCMVDVSRKTSTEREACAAALITMPGFIVDLLSDNEIYTKKGPVFATAIIAGTMAVKNTAMLIPFCHPLPIEKAEFDIAIILPSKIRVKCLVKTSGKTGVEMEALVGASTAALTIYDMCKVLSKEIVITETKLLFKSGGKSDYGELD